MRFLTMIKMPETLGPPPQALTEAMEQMAQDGFKDGTLLELGGLGPTALGARVKIAGGSLTTLDGPFTEAKEVIGGYAFISVRDKAEAIELTTRMMELHLKHWPGWEGEAEVRQVFGPEDAPPQG